jgi:DNA polymerase III delta prime subunit
MCIAVRLDPSLTRLYAYLQDHAGRGYPTEELAIRLFGYVNTSIWNADSSLSFWKLIHEKDCAPGEPAMLACDKFVLQWLLGKDPMDEQLLRLAGIYPYKSPLINWPIENTSLQIERMVTRGNGHVRLILSGPEGSGRRTMAAILSAYFGMKLLAVNVDNASDFFEVYLHAQRQAIMENCTIAWYGDRVTDLKWPEHIPSVPIQFIISETEKRPESQDGVTDVSIIMPALTINEQRDLIESNISGTKKWGKGELDLLLSQHNFTIGDIMALSGCDITTSEDARQAVRIICHNQLGSLAQPMECPFSMEDLVLPEYLKDSLEDFIHEAGTRKQFWENENARMLFPQGRGLITLFSGPPGTGKTMTAQVIAAELGIDLYRINISTVVSKYVGETSQNLERILSRASHMDIVLLFDEADALFGKRTEVKDAHDRFANTDTNYLLQAIENYQGIAILASNKKENIDQAFVRRLRYVLEFPKPDARQRTQLWNLILSKLIKGSSLPDFNGQLTTLANNVELTGSQIKFALLSAVFASRRDNKKLAMHHLIRGIDRELMKEGRVLTGKERDKLLEYER